MIEFLMGPVQMNVLEAMALIFIVTICVFAVFFAGVEMGRRE